MLRRYTGALVATLLLSACGGDSGNSSDSDNSTDTEVPESGTSQLCSGITLSSTSVSAGDAISLATDKTIQHFTYLHTERDIPLQGIQTDTGYNLSLPVTPTLLEQGGAMQLAVSTQDDGSNRCQLPEIRVSATTVTSSQSLAETLDDFEALLSAYNTFYAFDAATVTDEDYGDPIVFSTALSNAYFTDPDSPVSIPHLRSLLASATDEEQAYLETLVAQLGIVDRIAEMTARYQTDTPLFSRSVATSAQAAAVNTRTLAQQAQQAQQVADTRFQASNSCPDVLGSPDKHRVEIADLQGLSVGLKLSADARAAIASSAKRATETEIKNQLVNTASTAAAIYGGPVGTAGGVLAGIYGLVGFVNEHPTNQLAYLLPSEITDARIQVLPKTEFEEDYSDNFNNPGWRFSVSAKSQGLNMSKQLMDATFSVVGAAPGLPTVSGINVTGLSTVSGKVYQKAGTNLDDCSLVIPPYTWSNIRSANESLLDINLTGTAFSKGDDQTLVQEQLGSSELDISLKPSLFPSIDQTLAQISDQVTLENTRKDYSVHSATEYVAKPGEVVNVSFFSRHSVLPGAYQLDPSEGVTILSDTVVNDEIQVSLITPASENLFPASIHISSISSQLPPDVSVRGTSIGLELSPIKLDISAGAAVTCDGVDFYNGDFTATITGTQNDDSVIWSATGEDYTLVANGHSASFIVNKPGPYTITATSSEDPTRSATYQLFVDPCDAVVFISSEINASVIEPNMPPECGEEPTDVTYQGTHYIGQGLAGEIDLTPDGIRAQNQPMGTSTPQNWNVSIRRLTESADLNDDQQCIFRSADQLGESTGRIAIFEDTGLRFQQDFEMMGVCTLEDDGGESCETGSASVVHQMYWVFEHFGAADYQLTNTLNCSTVSPFAGIPGVPYQNLKYFILVYDANGELVDIDPSQGLFWNPIVQTACHSEVDPIASTTWSIPDLGEGAQIVINVSYTDILAVQPTGNSSTVTNRTATSNGDIKVRQILKP